MIAEEILLQLGGNRFIAMTGSKNFAAGDNGRSLSMKVGQNPKGVTHLKITLDPTDTYTMIFYRIRANKIKVLETFTGVYNDMLQKIFTKMTGLYTHL